MNIRISSAGIAVIAAAVLGIVALWAFTRGGSDDAQPVVLTSTPVTQPTASPTASLVPTATAVPSETPAPAKPLSARVAAAVIGSTVKVTTGSGSGSAFYIGNREFVTAAHVVDGARFATLSNADRIITADIVGSRSVGDIALLRARSVVEMPALTVAEPPAVGEAVFAVGYPHGVGESASFTGGIVSRIFTNSGITQIQTDAAANPGNSGGPLANGEGQVVGVIVSRIDSGADGRDSDGIVFATANPSMESLIREIRERPRAVATPRPTPRATPRPTPRPTPVPRQSEPDGYTIGVYVFQSRPQPLPTLAVSAMLWGDAAPDGLAVEVSGREHGTCRNASHMLGRVQLTLDCGMIYFDGWHEEVFSVYGALRIGSEQRPFTCQRWDHESTESYSFWACNFRYLYPDWPASWRAE